MKKFFPELKNTGRLFKKRGRNRYIFPYGKNDFISQVVESVSSQRAPREEISFIYF